MFLLVDFVDREGSQGILWKGNGPGSPLCFLASGLCGQRGKLRNFVDREWTWQSTVGLLKYIEVLCKCVIHSSYM